MHVCAPPIWRAQSRFGLKMSGRRENTPVRVMRAVIRIRINMPIVHFDGVQPAQELGKNPRQTLCCIAIWRDTKLSTAQNMYFCPSKMHLTAA
jgi:hypothetical protein